MRKGRHKIRGMSRGLVVHLERAIFPSLIVENFNLDCTSISVNIGYFNISVSSILIIKYFYIPTCANKISAFNFDIISRLIIKSVP